MSNSRETQVIDTFLALTDTLTREFDTLDFLTMLAESSTELLDIAATGVILTDGQGGLSMAAGSSEQSRLLEVFAAATEDGPCRECVDSAAPVIAADLRETDRWPRFCAGAAEAGFRAVHSVPMRCREETVGVVTFLHTEPHRLEPPDARLGQALADAATIGLLHEQAVRRAETTREQLQQALNSRIVIEQAKGVLATQGGIAPEEAFTILRSHARGNGLRLSELARAVVEGGMDLTSIVRPAV